MSSFVSKLSQGRPSLVGDFHLQMPPKDWRRADDDLVAPAGNPATTDLPIDGLLNLRQGPRLGFGQHEGSFILKPLSFVKCDFAPDAAPHRSPATPKETEGGPNARGGAGQ